MAEIKLKQHTVLLDQDDFEKIGNERWHITSSKSSSGKVYVYAGRFDGLSKKMTLMHRVVMNAPRGMVVDHINGDTLDNRKSNLRICDYAENNRNRTTFQRPHFFLPKIKRSASDVKATKQLTTEQISAQRLTGFPVSARQAQIIELMADGLMLSEISERLGLAKNTVSTHVVRLRKKLGYSSPMQLRVDYVQKRAAYAASTPRDSDVSA